MYGPIFDLGHPRLIIVLGTFLVVFGIMTTSLCTTLWQLILAAVAIIPAYFANRTSLAVGIAATGSSVGGVIYPIIFYKLQPHIGFPWAERTIGFVALATSTVPLLTIRMRERPQY